MDLLAVLRIAVRRWYVLMPLLVLAVTGGWAGSRQVQPTYKIDGVLPMAAPYLDSEEAASQLSRNSFLDLITTGAVMGALGESGDIRNAVEEEGGDPGYEIVHEDGIVKVAVSTDTPERALATYRLIAEALDARLDVLQADAAVPAAFRVSVSDALQPRQAEESLGSRQRVLIASVALGVILSIAVAVFTDYLLARRRSGEPGGHRPDDTGSAPWDQARETSIETGSLWIGSRTVAPEQQWKTTAVDRTVR